MRVKLVTMFIESVKIVNSLFGGYSAIAWYTAIASKAEEEIVGLSYAPVTTGC